MRILIADDNRLVASSLATMVRSFGHEVAGIASSGLEAIRSYSQCAPDVVLMDFSMAKLNGATASRMILSNDPNAKIVMLSGYLSKEDLGAMECGAVAGLPKPFQMDRLKKLLEEMDDPACN